MTPRIRKDAARNIGTPKAPGRLAPAPPSPGDVPKADDEPSAWAEWLKEIDLRAPHTGGLLGLCVYRSEALPILDNSAAYERARAAEDAAQAARVQRGANSKLDTELDRLARYDGLDRTTLLTASYVPVHMLRYAQGVARRWEESWPQTTRLARQYRGLKKLLERAEHISPASKAPALAEVDAVLDVLRRTRSPTEIKRWRRTHGVNRAAGPLIHLKAWTVTGRALTRLITRALRAAEATDDLPAYRFAYDLLSARYPEEFVRITPEAFRRRIA
jgi:hypothetical protein